jgi:hypothetical protein
MNIDQFVAKYNGDHINEDGYYGSQCWDVSARYAREVVGCPSLPTGSGGAEGLFRIFANPIPQYFDKIANNTSDPNQIPQKGDIIVWSGTWSPPWGHTAVCLSASTSSVTVLEQNGGIDDGVNRDPDVIERAGDGNADGVAYIITRSYSGISGWLRPKRGGSNVSPTRRKLSPKECVDRFKNFAGRYDITENDAVCQNRYEDPESDEFLYGMLVHTRDLRIAAEQKASSIGASLSTANTDLSILKGQIDELAKRPTVSQLEALKKSADDANARAIEAVAKLEKLETQDKVAEGAVISFLKAVWRIVTLRKDT